MRSFWTTADLLARGKSEREIRRAIEQGRLTVVRRGVLALPGTPDLLLRAARVGGVATAVTGAAALGLWTPPDPPPDAPRVRPHRTESNRLHVAFRRTTTRFHDPDDGSRPLRPTPAVVLHRTPADVVAGAVASGIAPPLTMLEHAFRALPPEHALAILDSALHLRFVRDADLPALAARLPARLRPVVLAADGRADSGIETITRYLLRLLGLRVEVHPDLPGIGEVDLLVEGRLIVELDGKEWHDDPAAFERDRHRDLVAATTRYRSLRFTWRRVLFEWPLVEAAVLAALAA
ncbi:type IV toxin-antitoxin system AbiEi family antitoxin domain-containing protein [Amnibacterium kyonggiense]|uniref:Putative AbiEi antitoxin of type IV toxin-antitoxin system n=1 Tax=Amnibacterium kyonggiense TaxID=595671 RepID=A0A4R7FT79_9MICO|nr:type IV toxin-antitoxin system AbiEi family antitoxin domain-containing protein [Amnibacterium kyonggiense]TDS80909.1 putative AbiEi antitoxin of type IV toxin-antitoxin system [Amnibacterium kyonggiense]